MVPKLNADGNLPAGIHQISDWQAFTTAYAINSQRQRLMSGLTDALRNLKAAGCRTVYIDGSFITAKTMPSDFDACWDTTSVDPSKIDPILLTFDNRRAAQKAKYGGELFPANWAANHAGDTFLDFFQKDKNGQPKGIVAIDLATINL